MAKFSKGQYVVLMRALRLARGNVIAEAQKVYEDNTDNRDGNIDPRHWAKYGIETAAKYIADGLGLDNQVFDREHFLAVIKGERPVNSKPPKG